MYKERVLIVTDLPMIKIAEALAEVSVERGAQPMILIPPRSLDGEETPASVAEAMRHADATLTHVSKLITHTAAGREGFNKGTRILVMTALKGVRAPVSCYKHEWNYWLKP